MKGKLIRILIASAMLMSVVSCGNSSEKSSSIADNSSAVESQSETQEITTEPETQPETEAETKPAEPRYSETLLPEERDSITVGKLSPEHIYYEEVVGIDPECADYINEISIYDKEIDDTFIVHVSLPPDYDSSQKYPMIVMTDGVWRLSDHPELRPLMKDGEIQDIIMVSVGYPNDYDYMDIRERDLVRDPESYLHFIVDNLVPYLSEEYSVDSENMTLTGHSYGGYWGLYALFNSDTIGKNTFKNYYIGSPSIKEAMTGFNDAYDYEELYYERNKSLECNVYVTVGSLEEVSFKGAAEDFLDKVKSRNYDGLNLTYEVIDDYDHDTVFKPSIRNTLLMFYGTQN